MAPAQYESLLLQEAKGRPGADSGCLCNKKSSLLFGVRIIGAPNCWKLPHVPLVFEGPGRTLVVAAQPSAAN